jgi:hypothetical protein
MHNPPRILVVDDNATNRDILVARLGQQGYDLLQAAPPLFGRGMTFGLAKPLPRFPTLPESETNLGRPKGRPFLRARR